MKNLYVLIVAGGLAACAERDPSQPNAQLTQKEETSAPLVCSVSVATADDSITGFVITPRADGLADVEYTGKASWVPTREPMTSLEPVNLAAGVIHFNISHGLDNEVYFHLEGTGAKYVGDAFLQDYSLPLTCARPTE
jgi:hypothetical protein